MRPFLFAASAVAVLSVAATPAGAQTLDRYGGQSAGPARPATAMPAQPFRVLTWAGKTVPQAPQPPQPQAAYAPAAYTPAPTGYYPSIQGAYAAQPYAAPPAAAASQPLARPAPPQGPPITVAPQSFYPPQVLYYPQAYQQLNGQPASFAPPAPPVQTQFQPQPTTGVGGPPPQPPQGLPTSIYDAPRPAAAASPSEAMQLAAMDAPQGRAAQPGQGARTYSIHRPFGRTPDPAPTPAPGFDTAALLLPTEDAPAAKDEGLGLRSFADVKD